MALLLCSCSVSPYLGPGEHVLHDVTFDVQMADSSAVTPEVADALKHVKKYYLQRPNTKALGKALTSCRPPMAISQGSPALFTVC